MAWESIEQRCWKLVFLQWMKCNGFPAAVAFVMIIEAIRYSSEIYEQALLQSA